MKINTQSDVDVLMVARFMFDHNYDDIAEDSERDFYWEDPEVRQFWLGQAEAILSFIGFAGVTA